MGLKTVEEIYQALLEDFSKRIGRDVSHSCDLAVRLYAVAAQVQALYAVSYTHLQIMKEGRSV